MNYHKQILIDCSENLSLKPLGRTQRAIHLERKAILAVTFAKEMEVFNSEDFHLIMSSGRVPMLFVGEYCAGLGILGR